MFGVGIITTCFIFTLSLDVISCEDSINYDNYNCIQVRKTDDGKSVILCQPNEKYINQLIKDEIVNVINQCQEIVEGIRNDTETLIMIQINEFIAQFTKIILEICQTIKEKVTDLKQNETKHLLIIFTIIFVSAMQYLFVINLLKGIMSIVSVENNNLPFSVSFKLFSILIFTAVYHHIIFKSN